MPLIVKLTHLETSGNSVSKTDYWHWVDIWACLWRLSELNDVGRPKLIWVAIISSKVFLESKGVEKLSCEQVSKQRCMHLFLFALGCGYEATRCFEYLTWLPPSVGLYIIWKVNQTSPSSPMLPFCQGILIQQQNFN